MSEAKPLTIADVSDRRYFRVKSIGGTDMRGALVCRIEKRARGKFPYVVHADGVGCTMKLTCAGFAAVEIQEAEQPDMRAPSELTEARREWPHWMMNIGRGWWQVVLVTPLRIHLLSGKFPDMAGLMREYDVTHIYPVEMVPQPRVIGWDEVDRRLAKLEVLT